MRHIWLGHFLFISGYIDLRVVYSILVRLPAVFFSLIFALYLLRELCSMAQFLVVAVCSYGYSIVSYFLQCTDTSY